MLKFKPSEALCIYTYMEDHWKDFPLALLAAKLSRALLQPKPSLSVSEHG